jgi:hypothetical protein
MIHRRGFCEMLAGGAATAAMPGGLRAAFRGAAFSPFDCNCDSEAYARFCAEPALQRTFHAVKA